MGRSRKIYALYRGDEFLDEGTVFELAEKWGTTPDYLRWTNAATRSKEREHKRGLIAVPIEEEK